MYCTDFELWSLPSRPELLPGSALGATCRGGRKEMADGWRRIANSVLALTRRSMRRNTSGMQGQPANVRIPTYRWRKKPFIYGYVKVTQRREVAGAKHGISVKKRSRLTSSRLGRALETSRSPRRSGRSSLVRQGHLLWRPSQRPGICWIMVDLPLDRGCFQQEGRKPHSDSYQRSH